MNREAKYSAAACQYPIAWWNRDVKGVFGTGDIAGNLLERVTRHWQRRYRAAPAFSVNRHYLYFAMLWVWNHFGELKQGGAIIPAKRGFRLRRNFCPTLFYYFVAMPRSRLDLLADNGVSAFLLQLRLPQALSAKTSLAPAVLLPSSSAFFQARAIYKAPPRRLIGASPLFSNRRVGPQRHKPQRTDRSGKIPMEPLGDFLV